jgi:hypothetical protein
MAGIFLDGTYDSVGNGDGVATHNWPLVTFNFEPFASAAPLSLNAAGNLVMESNSLIAYTDLVRPLTVLNFDTIASVDADVKKIAGVCSVAGGQLQCTNAGKSIL